MINRYQSATNIAVAFMMSRDNRKREERRDKKKKNDLFNFNIEKSLEEGKSDHYFCLSLRCSLYMCIGFGCLGLLCTIPAIYYAKSAQRELDKDEKKRKAKLAKTLTIGGMLICAMTNIVVVILAAVFLAAYGP